MLKAALDEVWFYGFLQRIGSINGFLLIAIYVGICIVGYLLGSVNTAIVVSKLMYGEDIRTKGSGNAGMTNMMRTYGKGPAGITLLGDLLKTLIAMTIGTLVLGLNAAYLAGMFAILGHIAPVFYQFRGGKGVAAMAMFVLYADPLVFLILLVLFVIIVAGIKFLSLGSIICAFVFPYLIYTFENSKISAAVEAINKEFAENDALIEEHIMSIPYFDMRPIRLVIMLLISFTVIYMHRGNIKRLMSGTERKFSFKKTEKSAKNAVAVDAERDEAKVVVKKRSLHNIDDE